MSATPQRIVCLSAEAADWFWRLGAWDSVAGVTAFFVAPPHAAKKPRVSGFSTANLDEITKLRPDLIVSFSDVQADLTAELVKEGFSVFATNQRTLREVENALLLLARLANRESEAEALLREFRNRLAPVENGPVRPRVYFEEWNEPLISGIAWVSELIERAGGEDVFAELRMKRSAPERAITVEQVCAAQPEIIFASWCGKPVDLPAIRSRRNWNGLPAVRNGNLHEIPACDILQPGFRLVYGYERMKQIIRQHKGQP